MSKLTKKIISGKLVRKIVRKNPYTVGVTAALLAVGSVAAAASKNERVRELKDRVMRRLSSRGSEAKNAQLSTATEPY
jgi:hypothetical protein